MVSKLTRRITQSRAAWAVLDQVLFGASTFVVNVLLARLLPEADYGAFALGFTLLLLIGGVQQPLLSEPMLVHTSSTFAKSPFAYQRLVVRANWVFGLLVGGIFGVLAVAIPASSLHPAFVGLAVAAPFVLYSWLMRRVCYANMAPALSAKAGMINLPLFLGGILVLELLGWLNVPLAFALMGLAALVSSLWIEHQWRGGRRSDPDPQLQQAVAKEHWQYGRWSLVSNFLYYIPVLFPYWTLGHVYGLEASASLRALENLAMPLATVLGNLSSFLVPNFVRSGKGTLDRQVVRFALLFAAPSLLLWLGLGLLHPWVLPLLYGDNYGSVGGLLWIFALQPLFIGLSTVFLSTLRAAQKPHWITAAYTVSASFMLGAGYLLIHAHGLAGAIGAMVATQAVLTGCAFAGWLILRRA
ncbi:MAG: lipopolysaccharide biosynthesis protein [Meiothermus sp.]|nr:lipopolysaccharide biosynthesis protein [Meiothermus sp.]